LFDLNRLSFEFDLQFQELSKCEGINNIPFRFDINGGGAVIVAVTTVSVYFGFPVPLACFRLRFVGPFLVYTFLCQLNLLALLACLVDALFVGPLLLAVGTLLLVDGLIDGLEAALLGGVVLEAKVGMDGAVLLSL